MNKISNKYNFQTGDIILFHHTNNFTSLSNGFMSIFGNLIEYITGSKYSHVGIIIRDPKFLNQQKKGLYILESGWEDFPDVEDNEYKLGVELEEFDKVFNTYDKGNIYWRKLNCKRDAHFYKNLTEAHSIVHNRLYDTIPTDWIKAALKINKGDTQKKTKFWCSALVAYIYTYLGLLPKNIPWTLISPKMLSSESNELTFINCTLDKEKLIVQ